MSERMTERSRAHEQSEQRGASERTSEWLNTSEFLVDLALSAKITRPVLRGGRSHLDGGSAEAIDFEEVVLRSLDRNQSKVGC